MEGPLLIEQNALWLLVSWLSLFSFPADKDDGSGKQ